MTSKKPLINRDNSPYSRWEAGEFNDTEQNLQDIITTEIPNNLVQTDVAATITNKKTFLSLFFTGGQTPAYNSVLDSLQSDISPVFGTGAKAIAGSTASIYELGFSQHNVSGVQANLAGRNPVFIKSDITLQTVASNGIQIQANNVPLYTYDYLRLGTSPTVDGALKKGANIIASKSVNVTIYPLTSTFTGSCPVVFLATPASGVVSYVYLCYDESKDFSCLYIITEGQEGQIPTTFTGYRNLGFFIQSGASTFTEFVYSGGRYCFASGITLTASELSSLSTLLTKYIKETCIVELIFYSNTTANYFFTYNGVTTYNFSNNTSSATASGNATVLIPMPYVAGTYPSVSLPNVTFGTPVCILKSIILGGFI